MVLFINIKLNQRVEVDIHGEIFTGTVKYKGTLNGIAGDWVGIALDEALGRHDGMLNGRRYFFARPDHGIFTHADRIRFIPIKRNTYSTYRPVSRQSEVDEALFTSYASNIIGQDRDPRDAMGWVSENYLHRASKIFPEAGHLEPDYHTNYHLTHSLNKQVPAATLLRPQVTPACFFYSEERENCDYMHRDWHISLEANPWISSPSIPKTHMPRSMLERQVERGWDSSCRSCRYVREQSVHAGRDSINFSQWNDISE